MSGCRVACRRGETVWCRSKDNTAGAKPAWSLMIVLRSSFLLSAKDLLFSAPHHADLRQTALKSHLFRRLNDLIACRLRRCLCRHCSSRRGRDANPSVPGALRRKINLNGLLVECRRSDPGGPGYLPWRQMWQMYFVNLYPTAVIFACRTSRVCGRQSKHRDRLEIG